MKIQLLIPERKNLMRVSLILALFFHPTIVLGYSSSVFAEMAEMTGGTAITISKPKEGEEDDTVWCTAFNIIMGTVRPTITAITPLKIPQDSTADLLITAPNANFNSSSVVRIEGSNITINQTLVQSATKISANISVPTTAARQFYDVFVDTIVGTEKETAQGRCALEVVEKPSTPQILSITPSKVQQSATVEMEIKGINTLFHPSNSVLQIGNGITGTITEVVSPTHLKASVKVDEKADTGFYHLTVKTDSQVARDTQPGGALLVLSDEYKIPVIQTITPAQMGQGKTTTVELNADNTHFTSSSSLSFSGEGVTVTSIDVNTTNRITATVVIDKEAPAGYRDVFVTTGDETASLLKGFEIQLNAKPTDITLSNAEIAETSATDSVVGIISTTDADTTDTHIYQLEDNAGGRFKIVGNELKVADNSLLITNQQETYRIKVISTDEGGQAYSEYFTIHIKYAPKDITLSRNTVTERSGLGVIGALSADDPNLTNTHTYSLINDAEGIFKLDGNNVVVANSAALKKGEYPIVVRATDNTGMTFDKTLTINVTDNPNPTDITYSTAMADNISLPTLIALLDTPEKTVLIQFSSVDPSSDDNHSYSFIDDAHANERFKLDGNKLIVNQALDQIDNYEIKIRTTDSTGLTFDKTFTIIVKNLTVTDNTIAENSESGTEIAQLSTTLPYGGDTVHTYLLKDDKGGLFKLDENRLLVANEALLKIGDYDLTIRSTEKEEPDLFFEKNITIQVVPDDSAENLAPTGLTLSNQNVTPTSGPSVGTLFTTDPNQADQHTYSLIESAGERFVIVENRLQIANNVSLETGQYIITVRSTDNGNLFIEKEFIITANMTTSLPEDGNSSNPPTGLTLSNNTITANTPPGSLIAHLKTVDLDINDRHTYSLNNDSQGRFKITDNQLEIAQSLEIGNYDITVRSTDKDGLFIEQTFQIDVVAATEDQDNDSILNYLEDAAPNNGDGNDDGIPDSEQPHVTSVLLSNQQDYVTLATHGSDCPLEKVQVNTIQGQTQQPTESLQFEAVCEATEVTLYYHSIIDASGWTYQQYQNKVWQEKTEVKLEQQPLSDQLVTTARFSLEAENNTDRIFHIGGLSRQLSSSTTVQFTQDRLTLDEYGNSVTTLDTLGQVQGNLITVPVSRIGEKEATVYFYSIDGEARQAIDYAIVSPKNGQLTWPKGETNSDIRLIILNDDIEEGDESFRLRLSNPSEGAQLGTPSEIAITIEGTEKPIKPTPSNECKHDDPNLRLSTLTKNITLQVGDDPITLHFTGGQDIDEENRRALSTSPDSEIVTVNSTLFPRDGGALVTLSPVAVGQTQLVISDCLSEAQVNITVEPALCSPEAENPLQPESEVVNIALGKGNYRLPIRGGQGKITATESRYPEIATGKMLSSEEESFLEISPKQLGHTYFTVSDCNSESFIDVNIISQCESLTANAVKSLKIKSEPQIVLIAGNEPRVIEISGVQGELQLHSPQNGIATGSLISFPNGEGILIKAEKTGHATFTVNDCISQSELKVTVLPEAPNTVIVEDNREPSLDISAYFETSIQKKGGSSSDDIWYGRNESLMLNLNLMIAPQHVGQAAGLIALLIAQESQTVFMHNGLRWLHWDGKDNLFAVTKTYNELPRQLKNAITLELESLPLDNLLGESLKVLIGYRLGNGKTIFNQPEYAPEFKVANGRGFNAEGREISSTAHFQGQLGSERGQTGNNLMTAQTEKITGYFTIKVDSAHQGQAGSFILVAEHSNGQLLMHNGKSWEAWDKQFASLIPAKTYDSLEGKLTHTLHPLNLEKVIGSWQLYFAYRLEEGEDEGAIIFNDFPSLKFSIANGVAYSLRNYQGLNTATQIDIEIKTENDLSGNKQEILETESGVIEYNLQIDPSDIGQAAQLILTSQVSYSDEEEAEQAVFIHNGQTWAPWDDNLNNLAPTQVYNNLPELLKGQQPLALNSLQLGDKLPVDLKIYIGYKLGNDNFIYNENTPLYLRILPATSTQKQKPEKRPCLFCNE
jgi:post-segregation antitoxin (ccd killing protein)